MFINNRYKKIDIYKYKMFNNNKVEEQNMESVEEHVEEQTMEQTKEENMEQAEKQNMEQAEENQITTKRRIRKRKEPLDRYVADEMYDGANWLNNTDSMPFRYNVTKYIKMPVKEYYIENYYIEDVDKYDDSPLFDNYFEMIFSKI